MYFQNKKIRCNFNVDNTVKKEAYPLYVTIEKFEKGEESIDMIAPLQYTKRKDHVLAEYDVRSDKWEIAQVGMERVANNIITKRNEREKNSENEVTPENVLNNYNREG